MLIVSFIDENIGIKENKKLRDWLVEGGKESFFKGVL